MKTIVNSISDQEYFELLCQRISDACVNIAHTYDEYLTLCFICVEFGDVGRKWFHLLSSVDEKYDRSECDRKFDNAVKTTQHKYTIGTLVDIAKKMGVDTTKPRGRHKKTENERQEEQANQMKQIVQKMRDWASWRFNIWLNRPEIQEPGGQWKPICERDLSTFYCRLKEAGLRVKLQDVQAIIFNRDFTSDFDPFQSYLNMLPKWKDGDPDYIHEFFVDHIIFGDPENTELYDVLFRKFFVGMVALWLGKAMENPLMPVLTGKQHIGKTYLIMNILPPELQSYIHCVNPAARVDKDFELSLSETPLMFLDEFSINSVTRSEAYKYAITSSTSYIRDSYGHFREKRFRKASLIAATNNERFIRDPEGDRRFVAVAVTDTVNLNDNPLPYEGAYAQAVYLLDNGFNPKPTQQESQLISEHNIPFLVPNDVEEALRTFVRIPESRENPEAYSSGDLLKELNLRGFYGRDMKVINVGKAMKSLGFESKKVRGTYKYLVVFADIDRQKRERIEDAMSENEMPF